MVQAESEIIKYRKAEELAKAFKMRAWESKLEFSIDTEKLLRDFIKDNLFIANTDFKENMIESYQDKDFLRSYSNRVMSKRLGEFLETDSGTFVRTEFDISESNKCYKARKYFMTIKL